MSVLFKAMILHAATRGFLDGMPGIDAEFGYDKLLSAVVIKPNVVQVLKCHVPWVKKSEPLS